MSSLSCLTFVLSSLIVHGSHLQLLIYNAHICTLELGINCLSALHLNITVSLFFCRSLPCLLWWDFWRISFYNMSSSSPLYPSIFGGWRWEIKILCVSTTSCFIPVTPVTPQILDIMHLVWTLTLFHGIKRLVCIYIPVLFIYLELQSGTYTSQHSLHINPADYSILVSCILLSLMKTDK